VPECWPTLPQLSADQRARLDTQLTAAREAHPRLASQSRRLTQGQTVPHGTLVNAYDPPMAPMCQGTSNCPAPFGRTPGMIAEPAAGFILGLHLPVGHPREASSGEPVVDPVEQARARIATSPRPAIHARAGALARNDAALREAWQQRGMLTVGIPQTVDPLTPSPTPEEVLRILDEAGLPRTRTPSHVHRACACGDSRPVIENIMASLLCRGAERLSYTGHRGAMLQTGMAGMAHNAATLVRTHDDRLSKRARKLRRRLRLRGRHVNQFNASIN
jgi:hypothetical protein